ncbi:hypothetical protein [Chondromyces crocatus]|uniref:Secreted protein n=1 Tax=Chondromyces crocatus TaxID=52 RepID=A0A0K1ET76_CHOCO|nr:hypothetical protein [Chondromyces crocatus]AKT44115.1 uncharacterized protein CMC5_083550 [Chondromyces crocatus]
MSSLRTFVQSAALAVSVALGVAPATALAEGPRPAPAQAKGEAQGKQAKAGKPEGERRGKGPGECEGKASGERKWKRVGVGKAKGPGDMPKPMTAKAFQERVEARLQETRAHLEEAMSKHDVPAPVRADVRKELDAGAVLLREAVKRVTADGQVTREEAQQVRELSRELRHESREKLRPVMKGPRSGQGV